MTTIFISRDFVRLLDSPDNLSAVLSYGNMSTVSQSLKLDLHISASCAQIVNVLTTAGYNVPSFTFSEDVQLYAGMLTLNRLYGMASTPLPDGLKNQLDIAENWLSQIASQTFRLPETSPDNQTGAGGHSIAYGTDDEDDAKVFSIETLRNAGWL